MNQLKSIYNSPFKSSHSHPIHTCLATIASKVELFSWPLVSLLLPNHESWCFGSNLSKTYWFKLSCCSRLFCNWIQDSKLTIIVSAQNTLLAFVGVTGTWCILKSLANRWSLALNELIPYSRTFERKMTPINIIIAKETSIPLYLVMAPLFLSNVL